MPPPARPAVNEPSVAHASTLLQHQSSPAHAHEESTGLPSNRDDKPTTAANLKRSCSDSNGYNARGKRRNVRVHLKRRKRLDVDAPVHGHHPTRPEIIEAHVKAAKSYNTDLHAKELPATSCGYAARNKSSDEGIYFRSLKEVLDLGYRLIEWDGITAMPLVCSEGRIFAVLAGQMADDPTYAESCELAYEAMMYEGQEAHFTAAELNHRRGDFPAVNVGITMGLGATYPTNLGVGTHADMLKRLLANEHIIRLANFADSAFNLWAPNVHRHYREHLDPLFDKLSYLEPIFPRCVFPAAAFNFGGNVCTKSHHDSMNAAIGWCAIFGLGKYDPKKGGHLVLPDLKLVIEFPPGALIMIPSATLTHANVPVAFGDSRVSFTQYCGGGLIRYVDNGYRTEAELRKRDRKMYNEMMARKATRWDQDLKLYDLFKDRVPSVQATVNGTSDN
ncbi:hypothetical protein FPV67DRAFT_1410146 [Lyophyllum atratum]|nr:hypothetical protein FPV67DRAFT_1410146 [Lyophyllum atratum]